MMYDNNCFTMGKKEGKVVNTLFRESSIYSKWIHVVQFDKIRTLIVSVSNVVVVLCIVFVSSFPFVQVVQILVEDGINKFGLYETRFNEELNLILRTSTLNLK